MSNPFTALALAARAACRMKPARGQRAGKNGAVYRPRVVCQAAARVRASRVGCEAMGKLAHSPAPVAREKAEVMRRASGIAEIFSEKLKCAVALGGVVVILRTALGVGL